MPVWNVVRIVPVGELGSPSTTGSWLNVSATAQDPDGLGASTNVYTAADPSPRTATHLMGNAAPTADQLALLQSWGTDVNGYIIPPASCPGVLCKIFDRQVTAPFVVASQMMSENGLTTTS